MLPPLRTNRATWSVPSRSLPALGSVMHDLARNESFDPYFLGQRLETTYFDTPSFDLRKARLRADRYCTLRIRCYDSPDNPEFYSISAKTELEKWRDQLPSDAAEKILAGKLSLSPYLPARILARLHELTGDDQDDLQPIVTVCCQRYAVEDLIDRFTLDVDVTTDTGLSFPSAVLEWKSTDPEQPIPAPLARLALRRIKLSKFLWSTRA